MRFLLQEYHYRSIFHLTHEEFLDEPLGVVEWMSIIDKEIKDRA